MRSKVGKIRWEVLKQGWQTRVSWGLSPARQSSREGLAQKLPQRERERAETDS